MSGWCSGLCDTMFEGPLCLECGTLRLGVRRVFIMQVPMSASFLSLECVIFFFRVGQNFRV